MHPACSHCGLSYERDPGYFLGAIYFNYGLTSLLVLVSYLTLYFTQTVSKQTLLYGELAFSVLFPLWFFRYARSLWIAFDQYFDPLQE